MIHQCMAVAPSTFQVVYFKVYFAQSQSPPGFCFLSRGIPINLHLPLLLGGGTTQGILFIQAIFGGPQDSTVVILFSFLSPRCDASGGSHPASKWQKIFQPNTRWAPFADRYKWSEMGRPLKWMKISMG